MATRPSQTIRRWYDWLHDQPRDRVLHAIQRALAVSGRSPAFARRYLVGRRCLHDVDSIVLICRYLGASMDALLLAPDQDPGLLSVTREGLTEVVSVTGPASPQLGRRLGRLLHALLDRYPPCLAIDCSELYGSHETVVLALATARVRAQTRGVRLTIRHPPAALASAMEDHDEQA